jgi:hypothetical protein
MTAFRARVAAPIRFMLAMMRLYAGIESNFGKAVLDILRKQYPDQEITETAGSLGAKLMSVARKQLQGNDTDSMDAIQNFLAYIATGSTHETDDKGVIKRDADGEPVMRSTGKPWDFRKDSDTWQEALRKMFNNLRTTAMSGSMGKSRRKKNERSVDDAFGTRDEDGGAKGNGEGRMPTPVDSELGKALDDHAAAKEFFDAIQEWLPELEKTLSPEEKIIFDSIMEDDIGSFGSDIKENMGHASFLKEKFQEQLPDVYAKHEKRWSGYVGDTKKKLYKKITDFAEEELPESVYDTLYDAHGADPKESEKLEQRKEQGKSDYQRGIDERKVARLKAKADGEGLSPADEEEIARLTKKLKDVGVDVESIKPDADAGAGKKKKKPKDEKATQSATIMVMAADLASRPRLRRSDLGV